MTFKEARLLNLRALPATGACRDCFHCRQQTIGDTTWAACQMSDGTAARPRPWWNTGAPILVHKVGDAPKDGDAEPMREPAAKRLLTRHGCYFYDSMIIRNWGGNQPLEWVPTLLNRLAPLVRERAAREVAA